MPGPLILWTGPTRSGKTTALRQFVAGALAEGWRIAGLLAPAVVDQNHLVGYDAEDISTGQRAALLRRSGPARPTDVGGYVLQPAGVALGAAALDPRRTTGTRAVIVDEFGPLETEGRLWRPYVDALVTADPAVILVVREQLAGTVARLYAAARPTVLPARGPDALVTALAAGPDQPAGT